MRRACVFNALNHMAASSSNFSLKIKSSTIVWFEGAMRSCDPRQASPYAHVPRRNSSHCCKYLGHSCALGLSVRSSILLRGCHRSRFRWLLRELITQSLSNGTTGCGAAISGAGMAIYNAMAMYVSSAAEIRCVSPGSSTWAMISINAVYNAFFTLP